MIVLLPERETCSYNIEKNNEIWNRVEIDRIMNPRLHHWKEKRMESQKMKKQKISSQTPWYHFHPMQRLQKKKKSKK